MKRPISLTLQLILIVHRRRHSGVSDPRLDWRVSRVQGYYSGGGIVARHP